MTDPDERDGTAIMTPTTSLESRSRRWRWLLALGVLVVAGVSGGLSGRYWWTRHQLGTAKNLLADLQFEEAGRLLDNYLRIRPFDAEAHLLAAQARRRAGDAEAAEYHLNESERLEGQTPASSLEGVLLLAERGALGDKESGLQSRLEKGEGDRILLLEALAQDYLITGREEVKDVIEELLKARPRHHRALVWRAQLWGGQHKWAIALEDAQRAVELQPDSWEARLISAEANEHVGETEKAVREYTWLYERGHKKPAVVLGLGRCLQDMARFADARQVLDAFLAEQPARADILVERGRLALREEGTTPAESYFRRAVVADPSNLAAHRFLLHCLKASGNSEESARVDGQLRQLEIREGRIDQLYSAVQAAPDDTEPRYQLGLFLLQNGREVEGRDFLNGVLRFNPRHEPARAALAAYLQRTGRQPGEGGRQ
jgi:Flp pilus assembly protein TadD